MSETDFQPEIIAYCCEHCAYAAADLAGSLRKEYPPNIKIIKIPCSGKADKILILKSLQGGADGVFVAGCLEGDCHFKTGNLKAKQRVTYLKKLLKDINFQPERVEMFNVAASDGEGFADIARKFTEKIKKLGPSSLKETDNE